MMSPSVPDRPSPRTVPFHRLRSSTRDPHVNDSQRTGERSVLSKSSVSPRSRDRSDLADLDARLIRLTRGAYMSPPQSVTRQKLLTELMRTITTHLWIDRSPEEADALHHVLHYIIHNLNLVAAYEWQTGIHASFIDGFEADCRAYSSPPTQTDDFFKDEIAQFALRADAIVVYITADPYRDWRQTYLPGRPDINCQRITLQRLQHQTDWKTLAEELSTSPRTLATFFQQQCLPKLRQLPF
ncbi:MAG: hypothetical protein AAFY57_17200 [Cyanobacteria bacterium J06642_2]